MSSINPVTPVYSKARPVVNEDCINCPGIQGWNQGFYIPDTVGKTTELIEGDQIAITDLSTSEVDRFKIDYVPIIPLDVSLTLVAQISSVAQTLPVLDGLTVDEVNLTWAYNKASVTGQVLSKGGVELDPAPGDVDRAYDYTSQTIQVNTEFIISGDDDLGNGDDSADSDSKSVTFGNYMVWGKGSSLIGGTISNAQTLYDALSNEEIRTNFVKNVYATGGTNEKFFVMYPKAWGEATFQKGIFVGGMMRLKNENVGGLFKAELGGGETEQDAELDNGQRFQGSSLKSVAYYIYESLFDNQEDSDTPIQIY